jgi:hypothetical protein
VNFADEVFLSYSAGFFNMPTSYSMGPTTLPYFPKKVVLQIFIALKNPSSSAGF